MQIGMAYMIGNHFEHHCSFFFLEYLSQGGTRGKDEEENYEAERALIKPTINYNVKDIVKLEHGLESLSLTDVNNVLLLLMRIPLEWLIMT